LHVFDEFEIVTNVKVFHLPSHPVAHPQIQILILILIPATTEFASNILLTLSDLYAFLLPPPPLFSPLCQSFSCFFFFVFGYYSFIHGRICIFAKNAVILSIKRRSVGDSQMKTKVRAGSLSRSRKLARPTGIARVFGGGVG